MSVTLTTDYGEYVAATEQEALKAARKAKREREREQKRKLAAYTEARKLAEHNAWLVVARHLGGQDMPCGWRYFAEGADQYPCVKQEILHEKSIRLHVVGNTGTAMEDYFGLRLIGHVENGSGFPLVAWFDVDGKVQCVGIAAQDGEIAMEYIPGALIQPSMFRSPADKD